MKSCNLPEVIKVANVDDCAEHGADDVGQAHLELLEAEPGGQAKLGSDDACIKECHFMNF